MVLCVTVHKRNLLTFVVCYILDQETSNSLNGNLTCKVEITEGGPSPLDTHATHLLGVCVPQLWGQSVPCCLSCLHGVTQSLLELSQHYNCTWLHTNASHLPVLYLPSPPLFSRQVYSICAG